MINVITLLHVRAPAFKTFASENLLTSKSKFNFSFVLPSMMYVSWSGRHTTKVLLNCLMCFLRLDTKRDLIENYVALPRQEGIETKLAAQFTFKCVNSSGDFRATQDKAEAKLGGLIDSETAFSTIGNPQPSINEILP